MEPGFEGNPEATNPTKHQSLKSQISDQLKRDGFYSYGKAEKVWPGLERRLGEPRITDHPFYKEVTQQIEQGKFGPNPAYFELGAGNGNDLRVVRQFLDSHGFQEATTLGIDLSWKEIEVGLDFYHKKNGEDTKAAKSWFAQGDFDQLPRINRWNPSTNHFDQPDELLNDSFDIVYVEAVLHALGYAGSDDARLTDEEKTTRAAKLMNHVFDLAKPGAVFFGRINARKDASIKPRVLPTGEEDWRYNPTFAECETLLNGTTDNSRFTDLKVTTVPAKNKQGRDPNGFFSWTFLAHKKIDTK